MQFILVVNKPTHIPVGGITIFPNGQTSQFKDFVLQKTDTWSKHQVPCLHQVCWWNLLIKVTDGVLRNERVVCPRASVLRVSVFGLRVSDRRARQIQQWAVVTNTLPCARYFSWHVNTLVTNTNTAHMRIYRPRGNDSEKANEEPVEDQSQQTVAQRGCLSASSCSQKLKALNILSPYHVC